MTALIDSIMFLEADLVDKKSDYYMTTSCLVVTGHSDLPETHLFIGLQQAGINIRVMCPANALNRQLLIDAKLPVIDLNLKSRFDRQGIQVIRNELANQQFDIIHAFNNKAVSNSLIATKGYDCKFIAYRGIEGNVSYFDPMSWMTYLHPRVDVIVCVADAIRRYFWSMSIFGIKLPVKKAITIYKGHNPEWYDVPSIELSSFGIPDEGFYVGCTVNDRPRKGLRYLIEATHLLPKELPIHFVFIGNIKNKELLQQINNSPYVDNIHLIGFQKQAFRIIKNCDVCILPATKREGLPKGIIEGMIQGVAPIVTDSGGSPELIEDGVSGSIIKSGSSKEIAIAIKKYFYNRDFLKKVKENSAIKIKEDFTIIKTLKDHINLYKNLTK
jgi:glycosyltransferase involved in cell wall biosynthesis